MEVLAWLLFGGLIGFWLAFVLYPLFEGWCFRDWKVLLEKDRDTWKGRAEYHQAIAASRAEDVVRLSKELAEERADMCLIHGLSAAREAIC